MAKGLSQKFSFNQTQHTRMEEVTDNIYLSGLITYNEIQLVHLTGNAAGILKFKNRTSTLL